MLKIVSKLSALTAELSHVVVPVQFLYRRSRKVRPEFEKRDCRGVFRLLSLRTWFETAGIFHQILVDVWFSGCRCVSFRAFYLLSPSSWWFLAARSRHLVGRGGIAIVIIVVRFVSGRVAFRRHAGRTSAIHLSGVFKVGLCDHRISAINSTRSKARHTENHTPTHTQSHRRIEESRRPCCPMTRGEGVGNASTTDAPDIMRDTHLTYYLLPTTYYPVSY